MSIPMTNKRKWTEEELTVWQWRADLPSKKAGVPSSIGYSNDEGDWTIAEFTEELDPEELDSYSRLFKAAPDLAEALEGVLDFLESQGLRCGADVERAEAALQKAGAL